MPTLSAISYQNGTNQILDHPIFQTLCSNGAYAALELAFMSLAARGETGAWWYCPETGRKLSATGAEIANIAHAIEPNSKLALGAVTTEIDIQRVAKLIRSLELPAEGACSNAQPTIDIELLRGKSKILHQTLEGCSASDITITNHSSGALVILCKDITRATPNQLPLGGFFTHIRDADGLPNLPCIVAATQVYADSPESGNSKVLAIVKHEATHLLRNRLHGVEPPTAGIATIESYMIDEIAARIAEGQDIRTGFDDWTQHYYLARFVETKRELIRIAAIPHGLSDKDIHPSERQGLETRLQDEINQWTSPESAKMGQLEEFIQKVHGVLSSGVSRDDLVLNLQLSKSFADCDKRFMELKPRNSTAET